VVFGITNYSAVSSFVERIKIDDRLRRDIEKVTQMLDKSQRQT